jgi:tetratricopeptide (TPR) repeat protein
MPINRPSNWHPPARPAIRSTLAQASDRPFAINDNLNNAYRSRPDRPWNRSWRPSYGSYYWNYHHHHWDYDCWYWGLGSPGVFYGDVPFGWLYYGYAPYGSLYGYAPYGSLYDTGSVEAAFYNPYVVAVPSRPIVYNYTQPVLVSAATQASRPADDAAAIESSVPNSVTQYFDAARGAFQHGDYPAALGQIDAAIRLDAQDAVLHEFRALVFFAMGEYDEAAEVLYSVLAAGPGWDWQTLSSCYADADTYATQLRALENYVQQNPKSAAANFVLGYQYMCLGNLQAAAERLRVVTQLQPSDKLSAALLKRLTS